MDLLQQRFKRIEIIVETVAHESIRKRAAKRGGDSSLIGRIFNSDQSPIHVVIASGVLFQFK